MCVHAMLFVQAARRGTFAHAADVLLARHSGDKFVDPALTWRGVDQAVALRRQIMRERARVRVPDKCSATVPPPPTPNALCSARG